MIIGRSLDATFPEKIPASVAARADACRRAISRPNSGLPNALSICIPARSSASPACRAWARTNCSCALFGATPLASGSIEIDGEPVLFGSPRQAIDAGVALVPEDRKTEGLFLELSGRENMAMPVLGSMTPMGHDRQRHRDRSVAAVMQTVQVDGRALDLRAGAFSGGNQQKMVLAKWLRPAAEDSAAVRPVPRRRRRHQA